MVRALPPGLLRVAAVSIAIAGACQAPEAFYKADAGLGTAGKTGSGGIPGSGGSAGSGSGGIASNGGAGTGGTTGTGGLASGGSSTGGSASGGASTGGRGSGGAGSGGAGSGGSNVGGGGSSASGGSGMGGMAGTGSGGRGSGGMATGGTGAGGSTGAGPCMGLCSSPISVALGSNSQALGTTTTCHEVVGTANGVVCGNFASPRTLTVNSTAVACTGSGVAIPAKRNGGYCMQATAGDYSYAYFATY